MPYSQDTWQDYHIIGGHPQKDTFSLICIFLKNCVWTSELVRWVHKLHQKLMAPGIMYANIH